MNKWYTLCKGQGPECVIIKHTQSKEELETWLLSTNHYWIKGKHGKGCCRCCK